MRIIFLISGLTLVCFVMFGVTMSSLGLLLEPVRADLGWTGARVSWLPGAFFLANSIAALAAGWLLDRCGARIIMLASTMMVVLGYCAASLGSNQPLLLAAFALAGAGMAGATVVPCSYVASRLMSDRLGLVLGIIFCGAAAGSALLPILVEAMISRLGWRTTLVDIGLFLILPLLPIIFAVVPGGLEPRAIIVGGPETSGAARLPIRAMALIISMQLIFTISFMGLYIHLVPLLVSRGNTPAQAVALFGSQNAVSAISLLVVGWLADRLGAERILLVAILLNGASVLLLSAATGSAASLWLLALFIIVWGGTSACCSQLTPLILNRHVPPDTVGRAYGISGLANGAASAAGPVLVGGLADQLGGYADLILVLAASIFLSAAILLPVVRMKPLR